LADIFTKKKRSQIMASISGKETKQEIAVRSFLFSRGFRFRKNVETLPGKPDIVLPKYKAVIFVNGCFWHGHNCKKAARPTSNTEFWNTKISGNMERDSRVESELKQSGWKVFTVWNCELNNKQRFDDTINNLIANLNS